jgi:Holliday junction resolvasome RuvABC endonuclease subunit
MSARIKAAQNQLNLASYDAEEAGRILRRVDGVMDAGGWGSAEKREVQQALSRLFKAQERVEQALGTMAGGVPMGVRT